MAKCRVCGKEFDISEVEEAYNKYYDDEVDYDDQYPEYDYCYECAITETNTYLDAGIDRERELRTGKPYYEQM